MAASAVGATDDDGSDLVNGQRGNFDTVAGGGGGDDSLRGGSNDVLVEGPSGSNPGSSEDGGGELSGSDRITTPA